ncbi:SRPBCC family protein [Microbacterium sp. ASV49]|uniref:SRPBCC family protein n=1 Tax=Microbacterium candidum TaxID=3041922 RepID=A0ABT7MUI9_9MICO|nr:SRPBCC family protein [Microbacterium sp. ASV49]MDL9978112.1 SRPBCC family protein [Microbacterium sp. ASV49]
MPVTQITPDPEALTMNVHAEFDASVERVWSVFTDPRQLERFWGPPGWPATFRAFDFEPGGVAKYSLTGPDGQTHHARWEFLRIDAPDSYEVLDGFADEDGDLIAGMAPMRMVFTFTAEGSRTRFHGVTHFESLESLEQQVAMGMVEGMRMAMGQLDTVLQDLRAYAEGKGTRVEVLDDQHVRITRLVNGPRELVWRAHTEPELLKQWLLGPDGWRMTVCEVDPAVGGSYRYAWEGPGESFGFDGENLVVDAPRRSVTTEHMTGTDYPSTVNDLQLYEENGATLLTLIITYPDAATRDMVLATGMTEGMETSYERLEREVLASV